MSEKPSTRYPAFLFYMANGQVAHTRVENKYAHDELIAKAPNKYFESPAEAEAGKVIEKPVDQAPPLEAGGAGIPMGYIAKPFPSYRFRAVDGVLQTKRVESPEELESLGAEWVDHPNKALGISAPVAPANQDAPPPDPTPLTDEQVAEIYGTKVSDLADQIAKIPTLVLLDQVMNAEVINPKGARKGVLEAINARRTELAGV